jgi:hypothetical protein
VRVDVPIIESASEEAQLVATYGVEGADAYELLGYEDDGEEDSDDEDRDIVDKERLEQFKIEVRREGAARSEGHRRKGGIKTQNAVVRDWNIRTHSLSCLGNLQEAALYPESTQGGQDTR